MEALTSILVVLSEKLNYDFSWEEFMINPKFGRLGPIGFKGI